MKEGAKPDWKELKMGSYKLLTGAEKLLALDKVWNSYRICVKPCRI